MKKWIFAGLTLILAFAITMLACDDGIAGNGVPGGDEFAQYSADGKSVTISLEGGTASKKMSRALTNALAQINHDYYEVVFYFDTNAGASHDATQIARTSWSRGEGASLAVFRGNTAAGIDYGAVDYTLSATGTPDTGAAILFVGKKESGRNVLLAVGRLNGTFNNDGTAGHNTVVTSQTSKVKFDIVTLASAIYPDKDNLASKSSFYTIKDATSGSFNFGTSSGTINATTTMTPGDGTNFLAQPYNSVNFPLFMLASDQGKTCPGTAGACTEACCGYVTPAPDCSLCNDPQPGNASGCNISDTAPCALPCCALPPITSCASCSLSATPPVTRYYAAKFAFTTATATAAAVTPHLITEYVAGIVAAVPDAGAGTYKYTEMVPPGFITNGEKSKTYTDIETLTVEMKNNNAVGDAGKAIKEEAYFIITVPPNLGGMIAFNFSIPVFAITDAISNNSVNAMTWVIQPGLERLFVDNGVGLGGSILLGIGDPSKIEILPEFKTP